MLLGSRRLRVLYFVSEYDRLHGAQRSLLQLVSALPSHGIDPIVLFPGEGRCSIAYQQAGIRTEFLPAPPSLDQFGQHLLHLPAWKKAELLARTVLPYSMRVAAMLKKLNANVLHCNTTRSLLLAAIAPHLKRYPIVWHVRGRLTTFSRTMRRVSTCLASRIILVADALRCDVSERAHAKCHTIYNGIDDSALNKGDDDASDPGLTLATNGRPVVTTMAVVTPFKGYHHLITAAHRVNADFPIEQRPIFLAVGDVIDTAYLDYLQDLLRQYQLDNFHFVGWKPNPLAYYRQSDLVVLPTVEHEELNVGGRLRKVETGEGFPRTVLEAMYLGKPVVATRVAGTPEQIISEQSGLLVPPSNPDALAKAIVRVLKAPPSFRAMLGTNASLRARQLFTTDRMAIATAHVYRELVNGH